jgi:hypothetical protein
MTIIVACCACSRCSCCCSRFFFQPTKILSAIPLSIGGAFVALLLARSDVDVPAMIGLMMLMGIVTKELHSGACPRMALDSHRLQSRSLNELI